MDSRILLQTTGFSHLKRKKRKKSSDDAATDGNFGKFVLRNDVTWLYNVEDDRQQENADGYWCQPRMTKKTEKIE